MEVNNARNEHVRVNALAKSGTLSETESEDNDVYRRRRANTPAQIAFASPGASDDASVARHESAVMMHTAVTIVASMRAAITRDIFSPSRRSCVLLLLLRCVTAHH